MSFCSQCDCLCRRSSALISRHWHKHTGTSIMHAWRRGWSIRNHHWRQHSWTYLDYIRCFLPVTDGWNVSRVLGSTACVSRRATNELPYFIRLYVLNWWKNHIATRLSFPCVLQQSWGRRVIGLAPGCTAHAVTWSSWRRGLPTGKSLSAARLPPPRPRISATWLGTGDDSGRWNLLHQPHRENHQLVWPKTS